MTSKSKNNQELVVAHPSYWMSSESVSLCQKGGHLVTDNGQMNRHPDIINIRVGRATVKSALSVIGTGENSTVDCM